MDGCKNQFLVAVMLFLLTAEISFAQQILVKSVDYETAANQSRLLFKVTDAAKHRVFVMDNPSRLVIDVTEAKAKSKFAQPSSEHPLFGHLRTALKNDADLRIVVDLKQAISGKTHKLTSSYDNNSLIVKLMDKKSSASNASEKKKSEKTEDQETVTIKTAGGKIKNVPKKRFIVAVDAGHGGDDPGAQGPHGTHEKHVTLAIAKKLAELINAQSGMSAKLVRKGDVYIGLRERMNIARKLKADLFVSIHADAVDNPEVRGASVYTLSRNGASSEAARWLANTENAKEKVGGVNLDDKEEMLATVLMDLSQTATQQASVSLADKVLKNFRNIGGLHCPTVQKAGFVVLKSPDIPSILVETAYISNPFDEQNLISKRYQSKMAEAIFKGVLNYYEQTPGSETNRMAKL